MEHSPVWPLLIVTIIIALCIWLPVRILHKAGYSGWWVLIGFVPLVNIVMVWVFAFADWPGLRAVQPGQSQARPRPAPSTSSRAGPTQRKSPHFRRI
jgi:uncharacterized membrane protein YhaH (DUF805 family)